MIMFWISRQLHLLYGLLFTSYLILPTLLLGEKVLLESVFIMHFKYEPLMRSLASMDRDLYMPFALDLSFHPPLLWCNTATYVDVKHPWNTAWWQVECLSNLWSVCQNPAAVRVCLQRPAGHKTEMPFAKVHTGLWSGCIQLRKWSRRLSV